MLKNVYGKEINLDLTKEGKASRNKLYTKDAVKFSCIMVILDLVGIIFKIEGIIDFNIVDNQIINILFNLVISFVVLFCISYVIDYIVTEYKVKKINRK